MGRRTNWLRLILLLVATACGAPCADWQATATAGFGRYDYLSFRSPAGTAEAGIGARYILEASIGRLLTEHLAIEGAWTFQDGDFELKSGGQKTAFDANAHSVHGDLYYYFRGRETRLRPFAVGGAGVKFYRGIEAVRPRPLAAYGMFADGTDARSLLIIGGGITYGLSAHWAVRAAIRDLATPFPSSVIVPAPGSNLSGWLHDMVVTVGIQVK